MQLSHLYMRLNSHRCGRAPRDLCWAIFLQLCVWKVWIQSKDFFFPRLTFCLDFQGPEFLDITQISRVPFLPLAALGGCTAIVWHRRLFRLWWICFAIR